MAWSEYNRTQFGRTYQEGASNRLITSMAPLHYQTGLDTGQYASAIDCTPQRIQTAALDGWRVTANDFHIAIGQPQGKPTDGWLGFGARQGSNWLLSRLVRVGYLHMPSRAWTDIGGAPTYNRSNLTRQAISVPFGPLGETITPELVATWSGIWSTPLGGDVSLRWTVRGGQLKEDILINSAARSWIALNRPPLTLLSETLFGFVFQLDTTDIPRLLQGANELNPNTVDADDESGTGFAFQDVSSRLLGVIPVDKLIALSANLPIATPLIKRLWRDGDGNLYLAVGVRCSLLAGLPTGDLVFDPTVNLQISSGANDGWAWSAGNWDTSSQCRFGTQFGGNYGNVTRFVSVALAQGVTITAANYIFRARAGGDTNACVARISADAAANPAMYANASQYAARTDVTSFVDWTMPTTWTAGTDYTSPDISPVIQDVVNGGSWASGNAMIPLTRYNATSGSRYADSYDNSAATAPKLDATYSSGSSDMVRSFMIAVPFFPHHMEV